MRKKNEPISKAIYTKNYNNNNNSVLLQTGASTQEKTG